MIGRKLVAIFIVCAAMPAVQASPISTTTDLYDDSDFERVFVEQGTTRYVFFQSNSNVTLTELLIFGNPINHSEGGSTFTWQLFQTDENWDTPNGNGDRLFYSQSRYSDLGATQYAQVASVELFAANYYRLSFITNSDWSHRVYTRNFGDGLTFQTTDGLFTVMGTNSVSRPGGNDFMSFSLSTTSVPAPGTLALLGLGLVGMGMTRRKKKA